MLKMILDGHVLFILMGIFAVLGVVSKCIASITLKRLVQAAGNMNKSTHPLIRLVRAKYEHACMINDKVQNVGVFVDKYLYEYKTAGLRLYRWRRMENAMAGLCLITGLAAALLTYSVYGMSEGVLRSGAAGAVLAVLLFLFHLTSDERHMMTAVKTYMVDYLENVCARRYEKVYQKEMRQAEPLEEPEKDIPAAKVVRTELAAAEEDGKEKLRAKKPEIAEISESLEEMTEKTVPEAAVVYEQEPEKTPKPESAAASAKKEKKPVSKEVLIREILEEFLA